MKHVLTRAQTKAIEAFRLEALRIFQDEADLHRLAQANLPGWRSHDQEWVIYEESADLKAIRFATFHIGGYRPAQLALLLLQSDARLRNLPFTYRLTLNLEHGPEKAWIDCLTGTVEATQGWRAA